MFVTSFIYGTMVIFNSKVMTVLLYRSETWRSLQKTLNKNTDRPSSINACAESYT